MEGAEAPAEALGNAAADEAMEPPAGPLAPETTPAEGGSLPTDEPGVDAPGEATEPEPAPVETAAKKEAADAAPAQAPVLVETLEPAASAESAVAETVFTVAGSATATDGTSAMVVLESASVMVEGGAATATVTITRDGGVTEAVDGAELVAEAEAKPAIAAPATEAAEVEASAVKTATVDGEDEPLAVPAALASSQSEAALDALTMAALSANEPITTMYDKQALMRSRGEGEYPAGTLQLLHAFGFESGKRSNVHYIAEDVMVYVTGNTVTFFNSASLEQTYLPQIDGRGIGAVAVHPSRQYLAVGEKGTNPNIYIYEYPSLNLVKMLRNGTERAYSTLRFNKDGSQLASVGSFPDFWLTVWNWKGEGIILRSKAFSQEVFHVSFSEFFDGQLITSGTGHVRFWKMAGTFTGLKLQGDIGKFGNVELSDIAGYCEMPDGKVLSGTERGELLIWDGGLIKVLISRPGKQPCHDGMIEHIAIDLAERRVLTAGADGYVRLWDFGIIDAAEPADDSIDCEVAPVDEMRLVSPAGIPMRIKSLIREAGFWVVQDEGGALWRVLVPSYNASQLLDFHAGAIAAVAATRVGHYAVTAGADGSVRLFDYRAKKQILSRHFLQAATAMIVMPTDDTSRTIAAGFVDGVLRLLVLTASSWKMSACCKPHKAAVTVIAVSPDGLLLATASADATVFFFDITGGGFNAVGFIPVGGPVSALAWSPDSSRLLVGCTDGKVVEYERADPAAVDTSRTYALELESRSYTFKKPKLERKKKKKAEKSKSRAGGRGLRGESRLGSSARLSGLAGAADVSDAAALKDSTDPGASVDGAAAAGETNVEGEGSSAGEGGDAKKDGGDGVAVEEDEEDDEEAIAREAALDTGVYPVKTLLYVPEGPNAVGGGSSFYLAAGLRAAGAVYECSFDIPERPLRTLPIHGTSAVTVLKFTAGGRYVLTGSEDGAIRLVPADLGADHPIKARAWVGAVHDCAHGRVTGAELSFDDAFLLSAAADGSFFVHTVHFEGVEPGEGANIFALAHAADDAEFGDVADIVDPAAYSIEEAKQKAEEDALMAEAERAKLGVREHLALIRQEFADLVARNAALSDKERLPRSEFDVDPDLRTMIEEDAQERMRVARLELQWDFEKARCALDKIRGRFLDAVAVERIVLRSFKGLTAARGWGEGTGHQQIKVTSFRVAHMSAELAEEISSVHDAIERESHARANTDFGAVSMRSSTKSGGKSGTAMANDSGAGPLLGAAGGDAGLGDDGKLSKQELRRLQRKKREEAWALFNATKPNDKYEKPEDVEAIRRAQSQMGDFKLKSDPDYIVPEEQRVNAEKKRRQMVLLEEAVHKVKTEFNAKFLALREVKRKICRDLESNARRISDINAKLGVEEHHWATVIQADEEPERREIVSDADLAEYRRRVRKAEAEARKGKAGGLGGFSSGGGGSGAKDDDDDEAAPTAIAEPPLVSRRASMIRGLGPVAAEGRGLPKSAFEEEREKAERIQLTYQKDILIKRRETAIVALDEAILELRREKFRLEADLKAADIKRLVMYKELLLLKEFEKRDVTLKVKLDAKMAESTDMAMKLDECEEKLEVKKEEVERLNDKRKKMIAEAETLIGDNSAYREPLLKIFLRKMKRVKKASAEEDAEEDDEDAEEEEDDDEEEEEQEVCPPGCDQALYERVCEMREKRLDQEDVIAEIQKSTEALKKEKEAMLKKKKTIESALSVVEKEIQAFQKEKQAELNRIDVTVALKMHQIEYLVDGRLPEDLSAGLVFSTAAQQRLKDRIGELIQEKAALRRQQKELRREHVNLNREKKAKEARVVELEARAYDVQMLKFGQVIDLELLDKMGAAKGTEELKAQLHQQEVGHAAAIRELERQIEAASKQLSSSTKDNTACLLAVSELMQTQRTLESQLGRTDLSLGSGVERHRREVAEQARLVDLVNLQAGEIERLRREVAVLRHKGGQVFAA